MNKEIKSILEEERKLNIPHIRSLKNKLMARYTHAEEYMIFRFMCALRKAEYYQKHNKLLYTYWLRRANCRGEKLGFSIPAGVLGKGVRIYHNGSLIINLNSVVGDECRLHGDNCIGNDGKNNKCPVLGKRIEIGVGAKIIGDVILADDIKIGANAVVTNSFLEPGITIVGAPAKKVGLG